MTGASLAGPEEQAALLALRRQVFVDEQGVPADLERDDQDAGAVHAVARDAAGQVVGTGRLLVGRAGTARIGRMAVAAQARGCGVGASLLAVLEEAALAAGCRRCEVHAQVQAVGFYRRAGYRQEGAAFLEAAIAHLAMVKHLS